MSQEFRNELFIDEVDVSTGKPMVIHNIGTGPKLEDMLFDYQLTGHYRYVP